MGDAAAVGFSEWNNNGKWEKGGAGSALLIGAALALFCKGRDKGGNWTRRGSFGHGKLIVKQAEVAGSA